MQDIQDYMQSRAQLDRFEDLSLVASVAKPSQQEPCFDEFLSILEMGDMCIGKVKLTDRQAIQDCRSLGDDAWAAVAMSLIPDDAGFMISRGPNDRFLVSIVPQGAATESTSAGSTLLLAVMSALALAVVENADRQTGTTYISTVQGRA